MAKKKDLTHQPLAALGRTKTIVIRDPEIERIGLEIQGTAPLILNDFAQKTIEEMLQKHMGGNATRKKKNPRECIENAIPRNQTGAVAVTPSAFKQASISGANGLTGRAFSKTSLRLSLGIVGRSIPILFEEMVPRMDVTRNANGTPDIRFRPQFNEWSARILVDFHQPLNADAAVDLIQRGGRVGIGEWRPERNGVYGTYRVTRTLKAEEMIEVAALCDTRMREPRIPEWALDADLDFSAMFEAASNNEAPLEASPKPQANGRAMARA